MLIDTPKTVRQLRDLLDALIEGDTVLVPFPIPNTREEPHYCLIATFKEAK